MSKTCSFRRRGQEEIEAGGGAPERVVVRWWNALSFAERHAVARKIYGKTWEQWDWDLPWSKLAPIGQQMRVHMHYDLAREAEDEPRSGE
jgi:hypothetical protein